MDGWAAVLAEELRVLERLAQELARHEVVRVLYARHDDLGRRFRLRHDRRYARLPDRLDARQRFGEVVGGRHGRRGRRVTFLREQGGPQHRAL